MCTENSTLIDYVTASLAKGEAGSETWEGDSALTGGGSSWVTGTYDPELDLVYGEPADRCVAVDVRAVRQVT